MKKTFLALLSLTALSGCPADSNAPDEIEPPAAKDIFRDINGDGLVGDPYLIGEADGEPIYETRYFFDDERLHELCLLPDADSFDDYEDPGANIPRGTTPISTECPADGIVTGPLHDELMPSSWCRDTGCAAVDETVEGGSY